MVLLEQGGGVAFDMKAGGPLELALVPKGGDPETVALRGKDVAALLIGAERAGPLRVKAGYGGTGMVALTIGDDGGGGGTTVFLSTEEMYMLRRAVESRLWRMYQ
jgi:hypothetical protein